MTWDKDIMAKVSFRLVYSQRLSPWRNWQGNPSEGGEGGGRLAKREHATLVHHRNDFAGAAMSPSLPTTTPLCV